MKDVVVCGGGVIGLSAAVLLADMGLTVQVIVPKQPVEDVDSPMVHAINRASMRVFEQCQIWQALPQAPMYAMDVSDSKGHIQWTFDAEEAHQPTLGTIVSVSALQARLFERCQAHARIQLSLGVCAETIAWSEAAVELTLSNGQSCMAQLVVGADGRGSWLRQHICTDVQSQDPEQCAIVATVMLEKGLKGRAWQRFLPTGPMALLPRADGHEAALIWSLDASAGATHMDWDDARFNQAMVQATAGAFGTCVLKTARLSYPLITQISDQFYADRCVLIGDAAHTIHPLLGQGANLGLLDVQVLVALIEQAYSKKRAWNGAQVLSQYQRHRRPDCVMLCQIAHQLNRLCSRQSWMMGPLGACALSMPWIKRALMRYALGYRGPQALPGASLNDTAWT